MKTFTRILLILGIILAIAGIGFVSYGFYKKLTTDIPNPVATMEVEGYGTVKIELYPDKAPNTVANFIRLSNRGFYNGLTFHRTIPDFMIQGGDKNGNGTGYASLSDIRDDVTKKEIETTGNTEDTNTTGNTEDTNTAENTSTQNSNESTDKEYNIPGEFIANGYTKNNLKHTKGVISMARSDYSQTSTALTEYGYNSASSQFFIMTADNTSLDGVYAAFGKVIEGLDIVEKIANVEVHYRTSELKEGETAPTDKDGNQISSDTPKEVPVIKSITVETYGVDYGIPKTLDIFDYYSWVMQNMGGMY